MITTIINNRSNITSIVRSAGSGQYASNAKPHFCAYTGDDANYDFQLSSKGCMASSAIFFQGGDVSEWQPHLQVEVDYTADPHTALEVLYENTGRTDAESYTDVKVASIYTDIMFIDEQGEQFVHKIGRVSHRVSDVDSRFTTSGAGTGAQTFNWPNYHTCITPEVTPLNDGFGTVDDGTNIAIPGRFVKDESGPPHVWRPEIVIDCASIEGVLDLNALLGNIYTALDLLESKHNDIREKLDAEGALGEGYPEGLNWDAPSHDEACTGAETRTAGTNDIPYY